MAETQLVLIPCPGMGHVFAAVELAKLLVDREDRLSVAVLIMRLPIDHPTNSVHSPDPAVSPRVRLVYLPQDNTFSDTDSIHFLTCFIESNKPNVTQAVAELASECASASPPRRLSGFVLDLFCTDMIDVADSFGVPSYVFFTSSAAFLGLMFYMQEQLDNHGKSMVEYRDSDEELAFPGFVHPLPARVLPSFVLNPEKVEQFLNYARRFRRTKGIVVNTFLELEPNALKFLRSEPDLPKVYTVGPILNIGGTSAGDNTEKRRDREGVLKWLDDQPASSVVFLCFGSMGSFGENPVREIAVALEKSGHRFLWSLRRPPQKGKFPIPSDYGADLGEVLPEGFLDRTARVGRVIGWAPQAEVLAHPSVGGFVSHCGWNSTLESICFGVLMATWPLYAEQQFNAFQLARELGLATEIRIDYRKDFMMESTEVVPAEEIERGIGELMKEGGERRRKVKELSGVSRSALREGGSSYIALGNFIQDLLDNAMLLP